MTKTNGEYRVRIDFNPSGHGDVDKIKRACADLIDMIDGLQNPVGEFGEVTRCKALAKTAVEEACMWGVEAVTKPKP